MSSNSHLVIYRWGVEEKGKENAEGNDVVNGGGIILH